MKRQSNLATQPNGSRALNAEQAKNEHKKEQEALLETVATVLGGLALVLTRDRTNEFSSSYC